MKRSILDRGLPALLMLAALLSLAALPARADDWSKTYTLSGKPDLRVDTSDANIHVSTWDQNTIEAKVTTTRYKIGDEIKIEEHQTGDVIEINVRFPHHGVTINFGNSNHRVDVDIHMPREGRVDLHTGDGHIDLDMPITTAGKIRENEVHGKLNGGGNLLTIHTGDGSIRLRKG